MSVIQIAFLIKADKTSTISADAAKLSADAALGAELPIFAPSNIGAAFLKKGSAARHVIQIANIGKTPAIILADCIDVYVGKALSKEPEYRSGQHLLLEHQLHKEGNYSVSRPADVDEVCWGAILSGETYLWLFGYIDYIDFTGNVRRYGFCFGAQPTYSLMYTTMEPNNVKWIHFGGNAYNYHKRVEELAPGKSPEWGTTNPEALRAGPKPRAVPKTAIPM